MVCVVCFLKLKQAFCLGAAGHQQHPIRGGDLGQWSASSIWGTGDTRDTQGFSMVRIESGYSGYSGSISA